ncbi:MAG: hypothetical protein U5K37_00455 [Natrialbaceae archaeon]|nr:hypothetical protein [Natrialbaceae archaeon]
MNERTTANLYWIQFPHDQGSLEAYLDAGTGKIHREIQELSLVSLPRSSAGGPWTNDDLVLTINETPQNGPIEVTVREFQDAAPVNATIALDGTPLAETGADGTVWVVPAGNSYEVTASVGNRTVSTDPP